MAGQEMAEEMVGTQESPLFDNQRPGEEGEVLLVQDL